MQFSKLGWKREATIPDYCSVRNCFLKAYAAIEFDSKNTADSEDHWTGTIKAELWKFFKEKYPVVILEYWMLSKYFSSFFSPQSF